MTPKPRTDTARRVIRTSSAKAGKRHTDEEVADAAERFDAWAEQLDPDEVEVESTDDLRAIADAADAVLAAQARLQEAVEVARARGRSWNLIAVPLGTSRQAARQRFTRPKSAGVTHWRLRMKPTSDEWQPAVDLMAALEASLQAGEEPAPVVDLMEALEASLKAAHRDAG